MNLLRIGWGHSASYFVYGFVCLVISEKPLCGKDFTNCLRYFYLKIIVTKIPTNFVTISLLPLFFSFHRNQKKELIFQEVGGLVIKEFLFIVYSELPSTLEARRIQKNFKKKFSYMLFLFLLNFHFSSRYWCFRK